MGLYRCRNENCESFNTNFEAQGPQCPTCGSGLVQELAYIHYLVCSDGPIQTGLGGRMVACDPKMKQLPPSASGHRDAVTCPACLKSTIFAEDERDGISNHVPVLGDRLFAEHGIVAPGV